MVVVFCLAARLELRADESEANKDNELHDLAGTLIDRVDGEANIEESDGKPSSPDDAKEA